MLEATRELKRDINISKYNKVNLFMKRNNSGYMYVKKKRLEFSLRKRSADSRWKILMRPAIKYVLLTFLYLSLQISIEY